MSAGASDLEELAGHGAATVHEAMGGIGAVDPGIRALDPRMRIAGIARTVEAAPGDNLILHVALAGPLGGRVLVVDARGCLEAGPWGEVMTTAALSAGCTGLIIDGAVRDAERIGELGFPVFARGLCIRGTAKDAPGRIGGDILLGGVRVCEGDLVVGDRDGIVVVPAGRITEALEASRARTAREAALMESIRAGAVTLDLLGLRGRARAMGLIGD